MIERPKRIAMIGHVDSRKSTLTAAIVKYFGDIEVSPAGPTPATASASPPSRPAGAQTLSGNGNG
ncbi:hypothetical protein DES40_1731 [Litorimonas taeanensis]|uniref:Elongation factor Tu-like protein n=1 Tax=Litorimonas taeanensis TaxID=568099 RepID=A0A420WDC6_9PROT|nr:hypothetical protein [Litorimonas taeanensis]RKQ68955.1 hypothetical protein DES40_1731 [Litorimonas taeanensis]